MAGSRFNWRWFAGLAAGIVVIQAAIYMGLARLITDPAVRGQFGDAFGVTNSLFSGLAVAGLICTLILQQAQINRQNEESTKIRDEAAAVLANQQRSNSLSALTFLMAHYDDRLSRLTVVSAGGPVAARLLEERETILAFRTQLSAVIASLHESVIFGLGDSDVR